MVDPVQFIELLRQKNGKPVKLLKWQVDFVLAMVNGGYREAFLFCPRKSGKTFLLAALAVYFLITGEQGSEIYIAAATKDQASILFRMAMSMIQQSPTLRKRCRLMPSRKEIAYDQSFIKALSSDVRGHVGLNPSHIIADELAFHKSRELFDVLWSGQGQRANPLCISITTANDNLQSFAREKYDHAKRVLAGEITDPTFYPVIFEGEYLDWESVVKANPSIGTCITEKYLRAELAKALRDPPHETLFRWAHLNQWVSATKTWLEPAHVAGALVPELPPVPDVFTIGLDLSAVLDLSCYCVAYVVDGITYLDPHIFIPEKAATEYERRYNIPYKKWASQGFITVQPGNCIDPQEIRQDLKARYPYPTKVYVDRWGASETIIDLHSAGLPVETLGQGFQTMSPAAKEFQRLLYTGKLKWSNPVLSWCCSHCQITTDPAGNCKPTKSSHMSHRKIDPIVAGLMALVGLSGVGVAPTIELA